MDGVREQASESHATQPRKGAKTLIEFAYKSLRKDIISGELAPGSKLRIEHLRAKYEIGASTLREALTLLVADSLVISEGQRGFKVAPISFEDLKDVTRMRKMMETMALMESIEKGDDLWEGNIVSAFHRLSLIEERLHDDCRQLVDDWEERNNAFHQALIAACPSRWILHFREILYHQSERYRRFSLVSAPIDRDVHAEHKAILGATLARDKELAAKLLEDHMDRTLNNLAPLLSKTLPEHA